MKEYNDIKPITNEDLNNLEQLLELIDPKKEVFMVTNNIIKEKKKNTNKQEIKSNDR